MKSPMSQMLMITLAIVFSTALTVTVTLLCISYMARTPHGIFAPTESKKETESVLLTTSALPSPTLPPSTAEGTETTETEAPSSTEPTDSKEPTPAAPTLSYLPDGKGNCTLIGIGTYEDSTVRIPSHSPAGDRVVAVAARALFGCEGVSEILLPATVHTIGSEAFADCRALSRITVAKENPYFCDLDGVLYSADLYTLYLYPPMRGGNRISIGCETARIEHMAFYNCANLCHVDYAGSAADWEEIEVGEKNYSLTAASKRFLGK